MYVGTVLFVLFVLFVLPWFRVSPIGPLQPHRQNPLITTHSPSQVVDKQCEKLIVYYPLFKQYSGKMNSALTLQSPVGIVSRVSSRPSVAHRTKVHTCAALNNKGSSTTRRSALIALTAVSPLLMKYEGRIGAGMPVLILGNLGLESVCRAVRSLLSAVI